MIKATIIEHMHEKKQVNNIINNDILAVKEYINARL